MNIHQKTSNRHRMQLTSTAYCRNKTVWHYFAIAIVLIFSMSAMATSRPKSKHKYRIRRIPEVILDSTIYEAIHRAIPALEAHNSKPFTWMVFSTKSMYACDTTTNLVGAVWAIKDYKTDNQGLGRKLSGFCRFGSKTVFFSEEVGSHLKKKTNVETITLKFTNDITKVYWGEFDPYEVKIIDTRDGYKIRLMNGEWAEPQ